jgi:hypothetical protein
MKKYHAFFILLMMLSCKNGNIRDQVVDQGPDNKVPRPAFVVNKEALIWYSDKIRIYGDSLNGRQLINYCSVKFEPYYSFIDFKTPLYKGQIALIKYNSNRTARQFKTRISQTYKEEGLNFSGHYCFVYWGCGSPCQESAIVDLVDGKVYDGPSATQGYEYRADSRMVILNPPDSAGFYRDNVDWMRPGIWI